jgi:adenosylcobinamide-phosphate synthase
MSWVPARITAVLLMVLGAAASWKPLASQASRTPSPNSGWPMAAMALVLGVRLGKPGVYTLNEQGRIPAAPDSMQAIRMGGRVVSALAAGAALLLVAVVVFTFSKGAV